MILAMITFGVLTVLAAIGVVAAKNPLHSALWLVLTLFLVAVHFAMLEAHFVAAVQVFVYAGAIMVLVIFVIMLLGAEAHAKEARSWIQTLSGAAIAAGMTALIIAVLVRGNIAAPGQDSMADGSTAGIGSVLFTQYMFPFELISLLILAAIIAAVVLGYEPKRALKPGRGLEAMRQKQSKV